MILAVKIEVGNNRPDWVAVLDEIVFRRNDCHAAGLAQTEVMILGIGPNRVDTGDRTATAPPLVIGVAIYERVAEVVF